jgi:hypothetical protein
MTSSEAPLFVFSAWVRAAQRAASSARVIVLVSLDPPGWTVYLCRVIGQYNPAPIMLPDGLGVQEPSV